MAVSADDKLFLTKRLAIMIKAGVPMDETLMTMAEQSPSDLAKVLNKVKKDVDNGTSLGEAFEKYPKIFDKFFVSLVKAGDVSGTLEEALEFLAEQMGKNILLKKKVQGALAYPMLVLAATFMMGIGISWFVLPQLVDMFASFEVNLPWSTRLLMGFAEFMKNYGMIAVPALIGVFFALTALVQIKSIRRLWDRFVLKIPFWGKVVIDGQMGEFSRNMGTLLKSGIPVTDAFTVTANTLSNRKFIEDLGEVKEEVQEGKTIAEAMSRKEYWEFGKLAIRMIGVGEKSGNLEEMFAYLATYYEEEIDNTSKNLTTLLEPVLLLFIGLVVGFVAMAIISPIYTMVGSLGS
ncbi:MAG TPA: type II secretion system F family protein [Candidatus Woesebacteria bacterium]|nr:type II secretion system F family protein [Candidatus Woesebacteria bacterium]